MMRQFSFLLLAGALVGASPASSQNPPPPESGASTALSADGQVEATIFQRSFAEIVTRHREAYSAEALWLRTVDGFLTPRDSSSFQLAPSDIMAFNAVREAPDPSTMANTFSRAIEETLAAHPDELDRSTLWGRALDGLILALDDPYASVFTPDEVEVFDEANTGNYSGIGIQITQLNERVTVTAVFRRTPAEQAGLLVGDIIVGVEDDDATNWTTAQVSEVVRGPVGTQVRIGVQREGWEERIPFVLTREEVHVPAVQSAVIDAGVGYVSVERVARNSAQEVDAALLRLDGVEGLILDLRQNPGGFLDEALMMADVFLEPGQTLASLRTRDPRRPSGNSSESWEDRWPQRMGDVPIVVLVDEFSASAAEIVAGALQDYDRALVIGDRSFGKGVVQTVVPLPFNHRLRITTGTWHTPLGRALHRPREANGRPLEENLDTFPTVRTEAGRELYATGGVFPDLEVPDDTLRFAERELLRLAGGAEVPLGVRIQEFAFDRSQLLRAAGEEPRLDEESFQGFLESLVTQGVPPEALADPIAREYMAWRVRFAIAERMDDLSASMRVRMERDPQLSEAMRLLRSSESQRELFAAARSSQSGTRSTGQRTSGGGPS